MRRNFYWLIALLLLVTVFVFKKQPLSLDLHNMCCQMVMVGVDLRSFSEDKARQIFQKYPFSGVILYDSLPKNPKKYSFGELESIIREIKENLSTKALIAIDQEGGYVQRLRKANGFTDYPSAYKLGISQEPAAVIEISRQIAAELKQLGINLNLAPVVDLNNFKNPIIGKLKRSFSSDPEKVYRYALSFVKGHRQEAVYCCLKHFPGHGSSSKDTHQGFVDVTKVYNQRELQPFYKLAHKVDFIMTSHTYNQQFDDFWPASLSQKTVGILRKEFNKIIITDDLLMGAITNLCWESGRKLTFEEIVIQAVNAGNDLLLFCDNFDGDSGPRAVEVIKKAVESGKIEYQTVYDAWRRIQLVKKKL